MVNLHVEDDEEQVTVGLELLGKRSLGLVAPRRTEPLRLTRKLLDKNLSW